MTIGELKELIKEHNIPDDTLMLSDSGWECDETDMDGFYYNAEKKILVFTQHCSEFEDWDIRCNRRKGDGHYSGYIAIGKEYKR